MKNGKFTAKEIAMIVCVVIQIGGIIFAILLNSSCN